MISFVLLCLLIGAVLYFIIRGIAKSAGNSLRRKFISLGDMQGKTYTEIVKKVGSPKLTHYGKDGNYFCVWAKYGYAMEIEFTKEGKFLLISKEVIS